MNRLKIMIYLSGPYQTPEHTDEVKEEVERDGEREGRIERGNKTILISCW